jgi:hypothetical protein
LAWNIGTTARMLSAPEIAITSACSTLKVCRKLERWV